MNPRIFAVAASLLAFVVAGYFTGWLVGASNTPVVSAALPLVTGHLSGGILVALDRREIHRSHEDRALVRFTNTSQNQTYTVASGVRCAELVTHARAQERLDAVIAVAADYLDREQPADETPVVEPTHVVLTLAQVERQARRAVYLNDGLTRQGYVFLAPT